MWKTTMIMVNPTKEIISSPLLCVYVFFVLLFGKLLIIKGIRGEVIGCPTLYDTNNKIHYLNQ